MAAGMWKHRLAGLLEVTTKRLAQRARTGGVPRGTVPSPRPGPAPSRTPSTRGTTPARRAYPGDFTGTPPTEYAPTPDGMPDPGEVVWAWVPYEEDHLQGKDRPALVIGRDGTWLLALPLTSKDHDRGADHEAATGRRWVDVGTGAWDRSGRASEARLDRIVRLDPAAVRREGAALPRDRFDRVIRAMGQAQG